MLHFLNEITSPPLLTLALGVLFQFKFEPLKKELDAIDRTCKPPRASAIFAFVSFLFLASAAYAIEHLSDAAVFALAAAPVVAIVLADILFPDHTVVFVRRHVFGTDDPFYP